MKTLVSPQHRAAEAQHNARNNEFQFALMSRCIPREFQGNDGCLRSIGRENYGFRTSIPSRPAWATDRTSRARSSIARTFSSSSTGVNGF